MILLDCGIGVDDFGAATAKPFAVAVAELSGDSADRGTLSGGHRENRLAP